MRRHFLGFVLAVLTFVVGFLAAPIRFSSLGTAHGLTEYLEYPCAVGIYLSTNRNQVSFWSCVFDEEEHRASDHFSVTIEKYSVLSATEKRAIVSYRAEDKVGYCILRLDGNRRNDICSQSLRDLLAFENQRFP